jgi:hypothetical protein
MWQYPLAIVIIRQMRDDLTEQTLTAVSLPKIMGMSRMEMRTHGGTQREHIKTRTKLNSPLHRPTLRNTDLIFHAGETPPNIDTKVMGDWPG